MKKIITFIHGFCMALADSVPGVSGGTVAFLLGFYDRFVDSLDDLISGTKEKRIAALRYLIKLGIGWGIGFLSAVLVLANVFESHIYLISSLFMGFILFAIPVVIMEEKQCLKEQISRIFFVLIGIAVVSVITYLTSSGDGANISLTHPNVGLRSNCNLCYGTAGHFRFYAAADFRHLRSDHHRHQRLFALEFQCISDSFCIWSGCFNGNCCHH